MKEVVVLVDGRPRPAVAVETDGDRTLVRYRDAGGFTETWVPTASLLGVEEQPSRPPWLKVAGLGALGVLGLVLVLYPGGNDRLVDAGRPTPTGTTTSRPTPSSTPTAAAATTAVLFGDSLSAGRGLEAGRPTLVQVAAQRLRWRATVRASEGTGFTTGGKKGGRPFAARLATEVASAPDVLLLQGGASDTGATPEQLAKAATGVLTDLKRRFPTTRVVLLGPVAMEQPADGQLVRVARTLKAVAAAQGVPFVDPIALGWVTAANAPRYTAATGYYPSAAGHAYLGGRLADALRRALA